MTHGSLAFLLGLGSEEAEDGADAARAVREEEASPDGGSGLRRGRAPFKQVLQGRGAAESAAPLL